MQKTRVSATAILIASMLFLASVILVYADSCPVLTHSLSRGSRGSDVLVLQHFLISQNLLSNDSVTGYFGFKTQTAVQSWQSSGGIISEGSPETTGYGVVGPKTRIALARCTSSVSNASHTAPSTTSASSVAAPVPVVLPPVFSHDTASPLVPPISATTSASSLGDKQIISPEPEGWDYDLKHECAKTTGNPSDANYYADTKQCAPDNKHWALIVESENAPGVSCPGPANRSFRINGTSSPVTMQWLPHTSDIGDNWSVNLKVDQVTYPSPCGDGHFTYFGMMDHVDLQGGPLPDPTHLIASHIISYAQWTPGATSSARLLVGAQFFYGGKAHILEINLSDSNWSPAHQYPGAYLVNHDWYGNGTAEYVALDGASWKVAVTPDSAAHFVYVPWKDILKQMIANGWFAPITGPSVTQAVYIGTEVKGQAVGNVWQTNFRVASSTP